MGGAWINHVHPNNSQAIPDHVLVYFCCSYRTRSKALMVHRKCTSLASVCLRRLLKPMDAL